MSSILVRDLDAQIVNRLKAIAKRHGRSLQGEIKAILTQTVSFMAKEALIVSDQWHKHLGKKKLTDSATLIREDRNR